MLALISHFIAHICTRKIDPMEFNLSNGWIMMLVNSLDVSADAISG